MNEEQTERFLRELKAIRICAVICATVFVLGFLAQVLRFQF